MGRALIKSSLSAAGLVAGLTLSPTMVSAEGGLESVVTGLESAPAAPDVASRGFLSRPGRAFLRGVSRAVQPMLNYSRHVKRLLPSNRHLPGHLALRDHDDYLPLFRWIPRGWTTFDWGRPALLAGNQVNALHRSPKPIGERGSYQISTYPDLPAPLCWVPLYFAFTLPNGVHFRLGARWDDVDAYVVAPSVAIKRNVK
jgi:hypothetical protein